GRAPVAIQTFGEAPCPNGRRRRCEQPLAHFAHHPANPLLFGGTDIGEGPSRFKDLSKHPGRAAFIRTRSGRRAYKIGGVGPDSRVTSRCGSGRHFGVLSCFRQTLFLIMDEHGTAAPEPEGQAARPPPAAL